MKTRSLASSAVLAAATLLLASCGDGDRQGGQCEPCRDANPRCDSGLTCKFGTYEGGTLSGIPAELCVAPNQTTCRQ